MVVHACNPWKVKAGESDIHPWEFKASLGCMRYYLKGEKKRKIIQANRTLAINTFGTLPSTQEINT